MTLWSEASARGRREVAVKNSATTRRTCGWLDDKRHAQQCRSICAVDSGKDAIQNVIEKARWRCRAEQLNAKKHDEKETVAGMQTKTRERRRPSVAWLNKKQSRKAEVKGELDK